jgi:hypothetical protein
VGVPPARRRRDGPTDRRRGLRVHRLVRQPAVQLPPAAPGPAGTGVQGTRLLDRADGLQDLREEQTGHRRHQHKGLAARDVHPGPGRPAAPPALGERDWPPGPGTADWAPRTPTSTR